jgi:hypothetical protein
MSAYFTWGAVLPLVDLKQCLPGQSELEPLRRVLIDH